MGRNFWYFKTNFLLSNFKIDKWKKTNFIEYIVIIFRKIIIIFVSRQFIGCWTVGRARSRRYGEKKILWYLSSAPTLFDRFVHQNNHSRFFIYLRQFSSIAPSKTEILANFFFYNFLKYLKSWICGIGLRCCLYPYIISISEEMPIQSTIYCVLMVKNWF